MNLLLSRTLLLLLLLLAPITLARASQQGDLISVELVKDATVGALLDEFPASRGVRERAKAYYMTRPDEWWVARVRKQLDLTLFRLAFRSSFYEGKGSLIIPDPKWIEFTTKPTFTKKFDGGHSVVYRRYRFKTWIVGKNGTAQLSDEALGPIGGSVEEDFVFPVDPQMVVQRTGFACMDEDQFPRNSVDSERQEVYYDDSCTKGEPASPHVLCRTALTGCHCTKGSKYDCPAAVKKFVGRSFVSIKFTKLPWNETKALEMEALNDYKLNPKAKGADLVGYYPALESSYVVYRYFVSGSCESLECLDNAEGWRRLLIFDGVHTNVGNTPLDIGEITYTDSAADTFDPRVFHQLYYFDPCHGHPHFSAYSNYVFDKTLGHKQGFCIEDTSRIVNHRNVTIRAPYDSCSHQGISVGFADNYNAGIPCQWIDVTSTNTTKSPHTASLDVTVNPKNWLCEGLVNKYPNGSSIFVPTGEFTTDPPYPVANVSIDKWSCVGSPGALANNEDKINFTLPLDGQSIVTMPCQESGHRHGPKRDCEFVPWKMVEKCTPGKKVTLKCRLASPASAPQVLRVCESSHLLNTGSACRMMDDDFRLGNVVITSSKTPVKVQFTCPKPRGPTEPGGLYSLYYGAVLNGIDGDEELVCA